MPLFRSIPKQVWAEQYKTDGQFVKGMCDSTVCRADKQRLPHVHTVHNNCSVRVVPGDWILPEPDGIHYYPVKNDIMEITYELVKKE